MGIMTRDFRPKPAYIAFATLARALKGLQFAGPATVTAPEGTFAYRFTPDPKTEVAGGASPSVTEVIALWNPKQSVAVTLPVRSSKATLMNTVGEKRALKVRHGQVHVELAAGKPVYVQFSP
jgi:hypothetical protein